jgi:hypothetical protein
MLLIALVVRSTTQKDKAFPRRLYHMIQLLHYRKYAICYHLHGTDKMIIVAIEGIVAHGPGGNQGEFLVL